MRQCIHCQAELPDSAQFCSQCGTSVEADQNQASDEAGSEGETEQTQAAGELSLEEKPEEELSQVETEQAVSPDAAPDETEAEAGVVQAEQGQDASSASAQDEATPEAEAVQAEENPRADAARSGEVSAEQEAEAGETEASSPRGETKETEASSVSTPREARGQLSRTNAVGSTGVGQGSPVAHLDAEQQAVSEMPTAGLAEPRQDLPMMLEPGTDQPVQTARDENTPVEPAQAVRDENTPVEQQFSLAGPGKRKMRRGAVLLVVVLVVVIVLAGGAGALVLLRQNSFAGTASQCAGQQVGCAQHTPGAGHAGVTRLVFSGAVSGSLTVSASPDCQATSTGSFRAWMVSLSGTVGEQLYNFGFVINRYRGPGAYSAGTTSTTILLDLPGEATNNGWGNVSPTDTGGITVGKGEQTGSISAVLSGFGSQKGTQVQVSGSWAC